MKKLAVHVTDNVSAETSNMNQTPPSRIATHRNPPEPA
jgi:hypothetical protein